MIRPICVKCGVMYAVEKQGKVVANMADFGVFNLRSADKFKCPNCGNEIIGGFAEKPFIYHHHEGFAERLKLAQESGKMVLAFVNLCNLKAWEKADKPI